jgi:hypothetical protein
MIFYCLESTDKRNLGQKKVNMTQKGGVFFLGTVTCYGPDPNKREKERDQDSESSGIQV